MVPEHMKIQMTFGSEMPYIDMAQDVAQKVLQNCRVVDDEIYWISLAVREAIINAMKHGNRFDPKKSVDLTMVFKGNHLKVSVADEGEGFDPEGVPNPLADENILKPSGRGIFYMRSFMDRVAIGRRPRRGMRIVMEKNVTIQDIPPEQAASAG